MGHHYTPVKYLKGFTGLSPEMLWVYDKKERRFFEASVNKIAQERAFYQQETEVQLNALVESPANPVIEKLRRRESIDAEERGRLAFYIAVMLMRVPHRRQKALQMYPQVLAETIHEIAGEIRHIGETTTIDPEIVNRRLEETEAARAKLMREPPPSLVDQIRSPWPTRDVANAVHSMTWRYLVPDTDSDFFMTTDNPAFFFEAFGLGRDESELSFPIASDLCLLGNRQHGRNAESFLQTRGAIVKEMNRRNASTATRFLFCRQRASWVETLAHKERPFLSRILWSAA